MSCPEECVILGYCGVVLIVVVYRLKEEIESLFAIFPDTVTVKDVDSGYLVYATILPECADIEEGFVQGELEFIIDHKVCFTLPPLIAYINITIVHRRKQTA